MTQSHKLLDNATDVFFLIRYEIEIIIISCLINASNMTHYVDTKITNSHAPIVRTVWIVAYS